MGKILNVTINGETHQIYKELFDKIVEGKHAIDFENKSFYSYGWTLYTKEEALIEMAKRYEFMLFKDRELLLQNQEKLIDAKLNEYLNAIICTKSIPMPKADSSSIAESITKFMNK
jgi:hypothetical protein